MNTLFKLIIVFTILLFACNAWAQNRPQCDVTTGLPQTPDQGICFVGPNGGWSAFVIYDAPKYIFVVDWALAGDNNFWRLNSQDKGFEHQHDKDGYGAYLCEDITSGLCGAIPFVGLWGDWSYGPVTLTVNSTTAPEYGVIMETCPYIIRLKGKVTDNYGVGTQTYDLHALSTTMKDPDGGCSDPISKVTVKPIN